MKYFIALALLTAIACESDVDKLKRLQQDRAVADLELASYAGTVDSLAGVASSLVPNSYQSHRLRYDSVQHKLDSVRTLQAEAMLQKGRAEAGLRRLLGGQE